MFPGSSPAMRDLIKPASMSTSSAGFRDPAAAAAVNAAAANAAAAARARAAQNNSGGSNKSSLDSFLNALQRGQSNNGTDSISGASSGDIGMRSCGSKTADQNAMNTMIECANRKLSMASNAEAALVDYDQKVMFIVNRATKTVTSCVSISTGKSTGAGQGQTPVGFMLTGSHKGPKYQSSATGTASDCIGLKGTDPETIARASNGVVIHKAHGGAGTSSTLGCIGIEDSQFDKVKEILYGTDSNPKQSAVFIFDQTSRNKCDGGYQPGSGHSGDTETGS